MSRKLILIALVGTLVLLPVTALAIGYLEYADPNTIGFYFEECGWCNELYPDAPNFLTGYVVLAQPTEAQIEGYVFGLDYFGPILQTSIDLNGGGSVNLAIEQGAYHVQLAEPLPTSEATVLATVGLFFSAYLKAEIFGRGLPGGTNCQLGYIGPNGFVDCYWPICPIPMAGDTCRGEICQSAYPLAVVHGRAPVANDRTSWSAVKSIYGGF